VLAAPAEKSERRRAHNFAVGRKLGRIMIVEL
jgi:hypothetical protein